MRVIESACLCAGWSQVSLVVRAQIWSRESQDNHQWTENHSVLDCDDSHEGDKLGAKGKNKGTSLDDMVRDGFSEEAALQVKDRKEPVLWKTRERVF